ncbi:hypothetical protein COU00_01985 [Candidatus Falkowbacteria bacterium CG10_big_fil_rev_8_21_14_0_10_43_11]|uniref:Uncharacterized protein n=1 Tax=Candidatus Falkowbacteria bacterium CG10_big_fil_rev_8_21_14_0_10_43_11 TaxID=1974568 RepID=A0A2M6WM65_9BACT|nr:MAG: hypothetical protein COU00_01985 [Candidatus Falkowbacteria bacterium CG10_big_fil_rev_8_21_14_0_10_43_11]
MKKDMLGTVVRKIVGIPLIMLGVICDLVEKLAGEAGQEWLAELKKFLRKEQCWDAINNIFRLTVGGNRTTEELVRAGKYDWVDENITNQNFPMGSQTDEDVVIELLEFDHDVSSEEAIEEARKRGLERPTHEDALFFGEQHPEEQHKHPIVFLHEPWQSSHGGGIVLVLYGHSSGRHLNLDWFGFGWIRLCVFAFVRK